MSPPTRTGLAIAVSLAAQSDVARIRFTLERITCINEPFTPSTVSTDKPLEDILLPGGIPGFENTPLDDSSEHLFADMFLTAAPGCYRVTSQPLTTQGSFSLDCAAATAPRVQIHEGLTTEQILINQCNGADSGGVDVVSTLNSPPTLVKLEFTKSKFIMQCQTQEVCATVSDPENDPVSFVWTTVSGPPLLTDLWVTSSKTEADGSSTQCVALVPDSPGQYGLSMTAYDLLHDPATGELVRIEDYLAQQGNPHPSHKSIIFPFYAAEDGVPGNCTPKSCQELKQRAPSMPSGNYTVDPDGPGSTEPFEVYCDMEKDGGGWTLALVSSDDEQNTWTWDQRTLMTTDQTLVGDLSALNRDFKSRALHALPFQSLLFVHAPSGIWASYSGVSNGTMDVASFMNSINAPVCDLSLAGHGYPQTAGTMALSGKLCDTNLYFHLGDFDGTGSASYCSGTTTQDSTYGPAWNMNNNQGCPFDDPGGASLGPDIGSRPDEVTGIGFGSPLGLNTGTPGTATNYIQMYIR
ncbi:MAG: hypothetical protein EOO71_25430 [Myxococcaceae bacterium]|nr:MAG: hypothetical protein EOO71_25430 [Myxococcaceae bacterium]